MHETLQKPLAVSHSWWGLWSNIVIGFRFKYNIFNNMIGLYSYKQLGINRPKNIEGVCAPNVNKYARL